MPDRPGTLTEVHHRQMAQTKRREPFAKFVAGQVILPANVMFCLVQYRVRPGEKCEFTTKSTKVTKRILTPAGLFVARQPSQFFSDGGPSRFRIPSRDAGCEDIHAGRRRSAGSDHTKPACLGRFSSFRSFYAFCGHSRQRSRCRILQTPHDYIRFRKGIKPGNASEAVPQTDKQGKRSFVCFQRPDEKYELNSL